MKYLLFALVLTLSFAPFVNASSQPEKLIIKPIAKPKIIGGELATQGDWPWMSALVYTSNDIATSLLIDNTEYESAPFSYSPLGQVSAALVDCGIGENQCDNATNKICLISRGDIDFSVKAQNCEAGGGIGAIIFNNVSGMISGTLGEDFSGNIPVVAISQEDGATLLTTLDSVTTIDVDAKENSVQSASCGATFIGEKWVLTAAHCVEDVNPSSLKVNVGEYDLSNGAEDAKSIKRIYMHPEYNAETELNNDIALIELTESIEHPAITLLDFDMSKELANANNPATVIGWGNTVAYNYTDEVPDNSQPDKLYQVELFLLSNQQCKEKLAKGHGDLQNVIYSPEQMGITDSMICAEYSGNVAKGSCQGDSGGPLLVNYNGWKQIGIVSYGYGCADPAFPDVYSRVGNFTDWINSITKGVAIEPNFDFPITAQNAVQTTSLTVNNNSELTANLSFSLQVDKLGSKGFTLNSDDCQILAAKQSCELQVTFDAQTVGEHRVRVIITSNDVNIPTTQAYISAWALSENNAINSQLSSNSTLLRWYTGGDKNWTVHNSETSIVSGNISNDQQSAVTLGFTGAGSLSFEWSVSSQENTDSPGTPYDALYVIVDGELFDFISGEVAYEKITIPNLSDDYHQVTWVYKKDAYDSENEDKGYLKNVIFTPVVTTTPSNPNSDDTSSDDSSGGSFSFMLIFLILCRLNYRIR